MGFFDSANRAISGVTNRLSGNADFLEAVCAAASLVAAADGSIDESEIEAAISGVSNNATLAKIYTPSQIEEEMNKQLRRATTIAGKMQLKREITEIVQKNSAIREDVFLIAADVANADGNIGDAERKTLGVIASLLGVDGAKMMAA